MEQNYLWNALAAAFSKTDWAPNMNQSGSKSGEAVNDFQKLLEQKSQTGKQESTAKETGTTRKETAEPGRETREEAPVKGEDALERVKKLAEMGYVVVGPSIGAVNLEDGEMYEPGEYVMALNGPSVEIIPTTGLDESQMGQLRQMLTDTGSEQVMDYVEPAAGQPLKETAPEEEAETRFVRDVAETKAEEPDVKVETRTEAPVRTERREEDDSGVEVTDVEQAPQRVFHDVETAPIKVGEAPAAAEDRLAADVSGQIDTALTNAVANGQSRVELQLTPENLGKVRVEITYNERGGVESVVLSAERSETRDLLSRSASNLQGLLSRDGQETVQVEVRGQEESRSRQETPYDGRGGHGNRQQEQRRERQEHEDRDFMQQLRLGLIPVEDGTL